MDYYSINQISEMTSISHMTLRRYTKKFKNYLRPKNLGNVVKYPTDDIEVLKLIFEGYNTRKTFEEIKEMLDNKFNQIIDVVPPTPQPINDIDKMLDVILTKQNDNINQFKNDILHEIDKIVATRLNEALEGLQRPNKSFIARLFSK